MGRPDRKFMVERGLRQYDPGCAWTRADSFRIIEPFQRGSGTEPLTGSSHVADLYEIIQYAPEQPDPL
jgi:hypothetical protein